MIMRRKTLMVFCALFAYGGVLSATGAEEFDFAWAPGVKLTYPQLVSVSLALVPTRDLGPMLQVEPGVRGVKVQAGYGYFEGWSHGGTAIKLSMLHMWADPVEDQQTFLGAEYEMVLPLAINVNVGVYWHVLGDDNDPGFLWSAGVGAGF